MAYLFDVNNAVLGADNGAGALFGLKGHLLTAGWTCPRSGNGTTGGAVDVIAAVADLQDVDSWMVLRRPDDGAEWLFARNSSASTQRWDVLYSAAALFIGGDATTEATATDEQFVRDNTTSSLFISGPSTWNYVADSAAPYGWACFGWNTGGSNFGGLLIYEPMAPGTYYDTDPDPYICGAAEQFDRWRITDEGDATNVSRAKGWSGPSATGTWGAIPSSQVSSGGGSTAFPLGCAGNPYSGATEDPVIPLVFVRNGSQAGTGGWKGFGMLTRWLGVTRAIKSTLTQGSETRIVFGRVDEISLPWPNGVVPA